MEYTVEQARKILSVVDVGLVKGVGDPEPGKMCVEAAICYSLGLPHGDDPQCVADAVRSFKIRLNDSNWSSDAARAKGLRALAIAQLGSKNAVSSVKFSRLLAERTIRQIVPIALRAVENKVPTHADKLEAAAIRCADDGSMEAVLAGRAAAYAYAADAYAAAAAAAADASVDAADAAAYAYAADAYAAAAAAAAASVDAADASAYAAAAAADAADAYAYAASAADAADAYARRDEILMLSAEIALGVLRDLNAPGVRLWDEVNAG